MQKLIFFLTLFFSILLNFNNALAGLSSEDKSLINEEIRNFILKNPELIVEALQLYEKQLLSIEKDSLRKKIEEYRDELIDPRTSYIGGNVNGSLTLIEFIDYKCGYCKKAHADIVELIAENPDLKYVVKELPILGPESILAAKASIALLLFHGETFYRNFTDMLLNSNLIINENSISNLIKHIGVDPVKVLTQMESDKVTNIINENYFLAKTLNIRGTPTFLIGTEVVRGYKSKKELQQILTTTK